MARQHLQELKQTGPIRQYILAFRDIMLDLPDMYEQDAIHQFISGLQYDARLQVLLKDPSALSAAFNYGEAYEAAVERAKGVRDLPQPIPPADNYTSDGITLMDLDAIRQTGYNNRRNTQGQWRRALQQGTGLQASNRPRLCYNCGGQRHIARECTVPPPQRPIRQNRSTLNGNARRD